jgi:hypothetical protein
VNGAGTHGNFVAVGTLNFPIFREARLRGDEDASAQMDSIDAQLADLRNHIDEQVRAALLDVSANGEAGGRGAIECRPGDARAERRDRPRERRRGRQPAAGDRAGRRWRPQNNLVESLYQYNVSKLALARAAGCAGTAVPGVSGTLSRSLSRYQHHS